MSYEIKKTLLGKFVVRYACEHCKQGLESPLTDAGKEDTCPTCGVPHAVPGVAELAEMENRVQRQQAENEARKQEAKNQAEAQAAEKMRLETQKQAKKEEQEAMETLRPTHVPILKTTIKGEPSPESKRNPCLQIGPVIGYVAAALIVGFFAGREYLKYEIRSTFAGPRLSATPPPQDGAATASAALPTPPKIIQASGSSPARIGDFQIKLLRAAYFSDGFGHPPSRVAIELEIANLSDTKIKKFIEFSLRSWLRLDRNRLDHIVPSPDYRARLDDEFKNEYDPDFAGDSYCADYNDVESIVTTTSGDNKLLQYALSPNKTTHVFLGFSLPVKAAKSVYLHIPAKNFGENGADEICLEIPVASFEQPKK